MPYPLANTNKPGLLGIGHGLLGYVAALAMVGWVFAKGSGFGLTYILGWQSIGVDAMTHFYDLDLTYKAAAYLVQGHNPYTDGSYNPTNTLANYPPLLLYSIYGLGQLCGGPQALGWLLGSMVLGLVGIIALYTPFFGGVCLGLGLGFGSGALALERGNTDLLLFVCVVAAVGLACMHPAQKVRPWGFAVLLGLATALKLYPLLALPAVMVFAKRQSRGVIAALVVCLLPYFLLITPYLHFTWQNTATVPTNSYGLRVLSSFATPADTVLAGLVAVAALAYFFLWSKKRARATAALQKETASQSPFLWGLCLAGAGIFWVRIQQEVLTTGCSFACCACPI